MKITDFDENVVFSKTLPASPSAPGAAARPWPEVHDFTSVVQCCVARGAWEAGLAVVEHMKRKELQPTVRP